MDENKSKLSVKSRWKAVDELRGFAVLLLFIFNGFCSFSNTPAWLRHAPVGKYFIFDLVAPLFLFAVGLSYSLSFQKRSERDGKSSAILHVFKRGLLLILFGTVGDWMVYRNFEFHWGTLEMIGLCGIVALPTLFLAPMKRVSLAIGLIVLWQTLLGWPGIPELLAVRTSMGGPVATLSWMSAVLIASAFSEWKITMKNSEYFSFALITILVLHMLFLGAGSLYTTNKSAVNAPYMFYSLQLALTAFFVLYLKELHGFKPLAILESLGKNALLLYMISGVVNKLALIALGTDISLPQLLAVAIGQVLLNIGIAFQLDRRKIYLAL